MAFRLKNGLTLIDTLFTDATLTGVGAAYGLSVATGKELSVMKGKVGTNVPAPGVTSSVTGQVGGFEKSRFFDSALVVLPDDTLNGWTLHWASGDNEGETQVVDDFIQSGGELRFAADFTNDIQAGDGYELFLNGIPAEYSLFNSGGTLAISQLDHEPDKISGVVNYLLPVGQPGGAVDIGAVNGDTGAVDLLIKASAVRANNAAQDKLTGTVTIRNNDDTGDLYSMMLDDNGQSITRTITSA